MENDNGKLFYNINDVINDIDADSKDIRLVLGVIDYDSPYLLHHEVSLHLNGYRKAKIKVYYFLIRIDMLHSIRIVEQK